MSRTIRLQYSGSGDFSEPDNGVELYPLRMPHSKTQMKSIIKIPGRDGGITQVGGANNKNFSLNTVFIGSEVDHVIKEQALDNLIWATDSDFRGVPLTFSDLRFGGETTDDIYL